MLKMNRFSFQSIGLHNPQFSHVHATVQRCSRKRNKRMKKGGFVKVCPTVKTRTCRCVCIDWFFRTVFHFSRGWFRVRNDRTVHLQSDQGQSHGDEGRKSNLGKRQKQVCLLRTVSAVVASLITLAHGLPNCARTGEPRNV